jgi:signal transduction histidine kinase/CheY-like chemotaxis protein
MKRNERYEFSAENRNLLESLQHPLAAYQLIDDKVCTLLISDGMCHMCAMNRDSIIELFNTDMYRGTHPDDVARVAELAHRFIITENEYDVTYRTILYGKMEYRYLHAISKFHTMENGARVAFTMYDDVTDLMKKETENVKLINAPKAKFMDENMSAMAVVERSTKKLLYYNKSLTEMIQPKVKYDSGRTLQDFLYHGLVGENGLPVGITGLYDNIDIGPTMVVEPVSRRTLEVTAVSSIWGDVPSYTLFFFENNMDQKEKNDEQELRRKHMVFTSAMNGSSTPDLNYYEPGYKAYWVWNLTKDGSLVRDEGHSHIHQGLGDSFNYTRYWKYMYDKFDGTGDREYADTVTLEGLKSMYLAGIVPKPRNFTVHNQNGQITLKTDFTMMQSPMDGDIYLKVTEENINDLIVQRTVLQTLVKEQFDFIVYIDVPANNCRLITGNSNTSQEEMRGRLSDFYKSISERIGADVSDKEGLVAYIDERCNGSDECAYTYRASKKIAKSIMIKVLNKKNKQYFICSTDVTEILKKEDENQQKLKKALETAESANRAKSEFVSRISHDIRTPINIISSMTDFAKADIENREKLLSDLGKINVANKFLLSLINDVLDISKIDSGKIVFEEEPYPYLDFIDNIKVIFEPFCKEKNLKFEVKNTSSFKGDIVIDQVRLNQITMNLLSNSVKYTNSGGSVAFCAGAEISDKKPGYLTLSVKVSDTGIGMSEKFVKKMFVPFIQEEDNPLRSRSIPGTGLGLAIVKKLLDLMDGTIIVQSSIGNGTEIEFKIQCPYTESDENSNCTSEPETNKPHEKLHGHILIAEDNAINAEIITRIVNEMGMSAELAENGKVAVDKLREMPDGTFDLILMDIQMPVLNGIEATKKIRSDEKRPSWKKIPIIAMTADVFEDSMKKAGKAGINDYLTKPIDLQKLYAVLEKYMG